MIEIGIKVCRDTIGGIVSDSSDVFTVSWIFSITLKPYSVVLKIGGKGNISSNYCMIVCTTQLKESDISV